MASRWDTYPHNGAGKSHRAPRDLFRMSRAEILVLASAVPALIALVAR
jgi:hypothetical protein